MIRVATPSVPPAAQASAPLSALRQTLQELLPGGEPLPPGDRERARLSLLQKTAEQLAALPEGAGSPRDQEFLAQAAALRQRAAEALAVLGAHAAREVPEVLRQAVAHWDQAGNLSLLPAPSRQAALSVQTAAAAALSLLATLPRRTPGALALLLSAAEAVSAIDSACTLLRAVEVRFVIVLREQLRRQGSAQLPAEQRQALLPGGLPFLDPGAAILALARDFGHVPPPAGVAQEPGGPP